MLNSLTELTSKVLRSLSTKRPLPVVQRFCTSMIFSWPLSTFIFNLVGIGIALLVSSLLRPSMLLPLLLSWPSAPHLPKVHIFAGKHKLLVRFSAR